MFKITYDILDAVESPDEIRDMGRIETKEAVSVFCDYPFGKQLALRAENPDLMAPTITYHDESDDLDLAIWSESAGRFTIWFPSAALEVDGYIGFMEIARCIEAFCDGRHSDLERYLMELKVKYSGRGSAVLRPGK